MTDYPTLFSPLRIKDLELPNRMVVPPLVQCRPIHSAAGLAWYARLAASGAGLIIAEATGVSHFDDDLTAESLRPLVDTLHAHGAAAAIQLFPVRFGESIDLNELDGKQLQSIIDQYGRAAEICLEAGFDGVEPHGAHSYMINKFFMPEANARTDEYGGSLENRCRFAIRLVETIRRSAGEELAILYRHTPVGQQYTMDDSLQLAQYLVDAGVDVLDISPAQDQTVADLAEPFTRRFDAPVIAVGGMADLDAAEEALSAGRCDLVAVGKQMIADPQWMHKTLEGRDDEIRACIGCRKLCFGNIKEGKPAACVLWTDEETAALAPAE